MARKDKIIFHADIDAFFASVEQIDNPTLIGKPVIVGAKPGTRGVVSACSYEARKYGIHSAMPISQAHKKCPNGIYLPVRIKRYLEVSSTVMNIFNEFTPLMKQISIDEAYLDMTGTERLWGRPPETAEIIKKKVKNDTGLTVSIGIAQNHYLAKLASEYSKPDGLYQVEDGKAEEFLDKLSLKDLWGIGKKTLSRLKELNITSIKMLRSIKRGVLKSIFGQAQSDFIYSIVRGIDPGIFRNETKSHSISNEITFDSDRRDVYGIEQVLLELCHQIMFRVMQRNLKAKTVFLKIRFQDFKTISAQRTVKHWICSAEEIYELARKILKEKWKNREFIRLLGVGVSNLVGEDYPYQAELFQDQYDKKKKVEQIVLKIRQKHKGVKLTKARLLKDE